MEINNELDELSINDLKKGMRTGKFRSIDLVDYYLEKIEMIDRNGPALNSILEINPDARGIASQMDSIRDKNRRNASFIEERWPLLGIPVLLKGNIDTADRMTTTAGSVALKGNISGKDAAVVEKLRKAGAVILGKTNLSEWANFRSTRSSSGWSSQGGQTRNPYILDRNPCGSSSGSAVAVSSNLCAAAIGTETDGSIICPSAANGIVGIKPTVGLVSQTGIIPISPSQDTAGTMARNVEDAKILLQVIADKPGLLETTLNVLNEGKPLEGIRIGIVRNSTILRMDVENLFGNGVKILKGAGAVIIDVPLDIPRKLEDAELEVLLYEFKDSLNRYLSVCDAESGIKSLADLINYNKANSKKIMPWFGQELLEMAESKGPLTERKYRKALTTSRKLAGKRGIDALLKKYNLNHLSALSNGPAWKTDLINGDNFSLGSSCAPAVAGYPNITVPGGFIHGLPVGISFFGGAYTEPALIRTALVFEQLSQFRSPPLFKKE